MKIDTGYAQLQSFVVDKNADLESKDEANIDELRSVSSSAEVDDNEDQGEPLQQYSKEIIGDAVSRIEEYTKLKDVGLLLRVDKELDNKIVVKLIDKESEEIIRQIPSEEALELSRRLRKVFETLIDKQSSPLMGQFLDDKA